MPLPSHFIEFAALTTSEASLYLCETDAEKAAIARDAADVDILVSDTLSSLIHNLQLGGINLFSLSSPLPTGVYSLLVQYPGKTGHIQVMERETMQLHDFYLDKAGTHLILLGTVEEVESIQEHHPFMEKIGPVGRSIDGEP